MLAFRTSDEDGDVWSEEVILLKDNDEAMEFFKEDNPVLINIFADGDSPVLTDFEVNKFNNGIVSSVSFKTEYAGNVVLRPMSAGFVVNKKSI